MIWLRTEWVSKFSRKMFRFEWTVFCSIGIVAADTKWPYWIWFNNWIVATIWMHLQACLSACLPACLLYDDSLVPIEFIESCLCKFACVYMRLGECECECVCASCMDIVYCVTHHACWCMRVFVFVRFDVRVCVQQLSGPVLHRQTFLLITVSFQPSYGYRMCICGVRIQWKFTFQLAYAKKTRNKNNRDGCVRVPTKCLSLCMPLCLCLWDGIVSAATQFTVWVVMRLSI